jgi:hypothetical protein
MMDMPAGPNVVASISVNGITYTPAVNLTQNGYRWAAWFTPAEIQYIRIAIIPALPDSLGGSVFTFGLTDFHAFSVQYHLQADVYTNQLMMTPRTASVQFVTETVPGITYFLSLGGNPAIEVFPGTVVPVPGAAVVAHTGVTLSVAGKLSVTLPSNVYLPSVVIIDTTNPVSPFDMRTAPGLPNTATPAHNQYITIDGSGNMYLVVYTIADAARTFSVSYVSGPTSITAQLHVQLTTSDLNTTPVFSGAQLVEV